MKPPSSISNGLLGPLFTAPDVEAELSDGAFLAALLDVESALARAGADVGIVPVAAADAIAAACDPAAFDVATLGAEAQQSGTPVVPLVRALSSRVAEDARSWVHYGATSQDVVDSALMLLARRAGEVLIRDGDTAAAACAELTAAHRGSLMVARTLGQQAALTTFGLKAAGWLTAVDHAVTRLRTVVRTGLAVQLGGAAGTLATFGPAGPAALAAFATRLDLVEPSIPWHTDRQRVLDLAVALGGIVTAVGKVALDVELLAQTEVGEVSEGGDDPRRGASSALPHKRNPVDAVLIRSAAYRAPGLVATLLATAQQEHERAAGAWHAEWDTLRQLMSIAGGAVARAGALLSSLDIDTGRMRSNVDDTGGLVMSESVAAALTARVGRAPAQALVARCSTQVTAHGRSFYEIVQADDEISQHLTSDDFESAFDAGPVLASAGRLVDRALAAYRSGDSHGSHP
jgi:3-carboxy-cis,cis-muconate cycloisomerase